MSHSSSDDLNAAPAENLAQIMARIGQVATECGRRAQDITLIAVSKRQPLENIKALLAAGHRVFGENRVQEAAEKWPALKAAYPDLSLHMIGALQTNKVPQAVVLFDVIHTLDREKLARKLAEEMARTGRRLPVFIQVNTGEEPQKSGIAPRHVDAFVRLCRDDLNLPVVGLMCLPPVDEEPALHFALLAKLAARNALDQLSMGMSADYEKAIAFGATHIRLGRALLGPRQD